MIKNDLVPKKTKKNIGKKSDFWEDKAFIKAIKILYNAKKKSAERDMKFFSKKV